MSLVPSVFRARPFRGVRACFLAFVLALGLAIGSPGAAADELPWITTRGRDFVDERGEVVAMRGVNLGGWLMMETWIPGIALDWEAHLMFLAREAGIERELLSAYEVAGEFDDDTTSIQIYLADLRAAMVGIAGAERTDAYWTKVGEELPVVDPRTLHRLLVTRFGEEGAARFWRAWHDTWIDESDFRRIAELGFDFVRIPFWYVWFQSDEAPYPILEEGEGFRTLDRAVEWGRAHGVRLWLDLHGAPGGQNPWEHSGDIYKGELFKDAEAKARTYSLWKAIAARYSDEPVVFAYGALNEPASALGREDWIEVHDGIHDAIRSVDPRHVIVMEDGYKLEEEPFLSKGFFPDPSELGWTGVAYSAHFYQTGSMEAHNARAAMLREIGLREQARTGVPMIVGEFNAIHDSPAGLEAMRFYARVFNEAGWGWAPWTWKFTGAAPQDRTLWGVMQFDAASHGEWKTPVVQRASLEELLEAVARLRSENFAPKPHYAGVLREALAAPAVSAERGHGPKRD